MHTGGPRLCCLQPQGGQNSGACHAEQPHPFTPARRVNSVLSVIEES